MLKHLSPISGVATFGTRYVATAGYDNRVILWDDEKRLPIARANHDHLANQCQFSPCGNYLVTASSDYSARVWEVPSMRLHVLLAGHQDDVEMAAFSPCGDYIATACRDYCVRIYRLDGTLVHRMEGHGGDVNSVQWSEDGSELVSSSDNGSVCRWSATAGKLIEMIDLGDVDTDTIVAGPDGLYFAGNHEGEIVIIGSKTTRVQAHEAGIKRLTYRAERGLLVSLSYDGRIRLWQFTPEGGLSLQETIEVPALVWMRSVEVNEAGRVILGTFGSSYAAYDLAAGEWDFRTVEDTPGVNGCAAIEGAVWTVGDAGVVRADGHVQSRLGSLCNFVTQWGDSVIAGGQTGEIFEARSGVVVHKHRSPLNCGVAFPHQGEMWFAVGSYTGETILLRQGADGIEHVRDVRFHDNAIKDMAYNAGTLCSVCATGTAAFVDAERLELINHVPKAHDKIANGIASVGGGVFATVSRDLVLRIWKGGVATAFPSPHDHSIKCVAACEQTGLVITGAYDGTVGMFDTRREAWLGTVRPTMAGISSVAPGFGPGEFLASSYDGSVYPIAFDLFDQEHQDSNRAAA